MFVEMVMTHAGTQAGDGEVPEKEELRARLERHEARTKRVEEAILEVEARARKIEYSLLAVSTKLGISTVKNFGSKVFPSKFPDLSSESPLIVSGRYRGTFPDTLKVNGILADMSNFHIDLKVEKAKEIPVGKIVANHQIELLTAEAWYSENVELKEKVAKMSVQHAIVSESYMVLLEIQQGKLSADSTVAPQAPGRFSVDRQGMDNNGVDLFYTLDEALDMVGFGKFQALVLSYAGLGAMAEAMEVMILSFIGSSVKSEWGLSSGQQSLITTVVFAGMLIGAYLWGFICDNYGRRIGLLSVAVVTSIFAFLSAFSPNYVSLVIFRMVAGIGLGGGPVYSSWYLEFVPVRNRGFWMVIFSTFWTIGSILEALLAWIIIPRLGWRWLLALSSVPCLLAFAFYFLTVESPRYLHLKGKITDAHIVLKKIAAVNKSELPSGTLVSHHPSNEHEEGNSTSENGQLLFFRKHKVNISIPGLSLLVTLLSSNLVKTTLLLWVIYFANSFAYYGVVLLTSELSSGQSKCGVILLYSNKSSTGSSLYRNVFITSLAEIPGLILSAVLVDKIGRRISMALMYSFGFIFLLPLIFHQHELITTLLLFGARMCIIGTYTVAGIYCPELYPTSVRTTGVGVATAVGRVAGMICPVVAVGLVSSCHQMAAISLFEVVIILAGSSVVLLPVETKGRKLVDIVAVNR
ncbi:hypothetical protein OROGR_017873 [Orobanche gracilis]